MGCGASAPASDVQSQRGPVVEGVARNDASPPITGEPEVAEVAPKAAASSYKSIIQQIHSTIQPAAVKDQANDIMAKIHSAIKPASLKGIGATQAQAPAPAPAQAPAPAPAPTPAPNTTPDPPEYLPDDVQKLFLNLTARSEDAQLFYYEGVAGRGENVWGWYQIVAEFRVASSEILLDVDFESKNPTSVPSYEAKNHMTWDQETGAVVQTNGSWQGQVSGAGGVFRLKNKFGDDLNFLPMPFMWHYTLGCKPSEMGGIAARVAELLSKLSVPGKRIRVWHDYHKDDSERRSAIEQSANYILLLSPGVWNCQPAVTDLRAAKEMGKNLVLVWDPTGDETHVPVHPTPHSPVDFGSVAASMGDIIGSAPADLKDLFSDIECLPYRSHPFAEVATIQQIARVGGFEGVLEPAVHQDPITELATPEPVESDTVYYEGTAHSSDVEEGYYQAVATFSEDSVFFDITYEASKKGWMPSYKGTKTLMWDPEEGTVEESDATGDETSDHDWAGALAGRGAQLSLSNTKEYSIELNPRPFIWHYYFQGVDAEVGKVSSLLGSRLADSAARGRRPRCYEAYDQADDDTRRAALSVSANFAMFLSKSVWTTESCLEDLRIAMQMGKNIILLQEPDARMTGYSPIIDIVAAAPPDTAELLANHDVYPYYRRGYEQDALLMHLLQIGGFPESVPVPDPRDNAFFLGSQNNADDLQIMQQNRWKYYEGTAGRTGNVWGWYQIDAKFKPDENAVDMLVEFESKNPASIPGYESLNTFEWTVSSGQIHQTNGSWNGTLEDGLGSTFHLTNKYGDTLTFVPQPFIWHFFLSHVQREAADACALLVAKLKESSVRGRRMRVWYDNKASAINKASMQEGVRGSASYVLFLTPSVFNSQYVMFEFETAIGQGKDVLLLYHADPAAKGHVEPEEFVTKAPEKFKAALAAAQTIPFFDQGPGLDKCLKDLMIAGGFPDNIAI